MTRGSALLAALIAVSLGATRTRAQDAAVPAAHDAGPPAIADSSGSGGSGRRYPLFGPFANRPGQWDAGRDALVAAGAAPPERRTARIDARRLFAERRARDGALAALHRFADDAMSDARVLPTVATAVHRAIDRRSQVSATRRLTDGGAVVEVVVPGAALRRASGERGALPWQRSVR